MSLRGPYRSWLVARVVFANIALISLVFLVSAATDEGNLTLAVRVGRVLPLVPIASAIAVKVVLAGVKSRGEITALGALGASPREIALACAFAALVAPVLAALAIVTARVDVDGFYPAPPAAPVVAPAAAGGGFVSGDLGITIDDAGEPHALTSPAPTSPPSALPLHAPAAAALTTLVASLALALAFAREKSRLVLHVPAVVALVLALVAFQLAAAKLLPAFAAAVPMLGLLAIEVRAYLREA